MNKRIIALVAVMLITAALIFVVFSMLRIKAATSNGQFVWDSRADFLSNSSTTGDSTTMGNISVSSDGELSIDDYDSDLKKVDDFQITGWVNDQSDLVYDNQGNFLIATSNDTVKIYKYNSNNELVINGATVYDGSLGSAAKISVDTDLLGNFIIGFLVNWSDFYVTKIDGNGNTLVAPFKVNILSSISDSSPPQVKCTSDGFVTAYICNDNVYIKKFDSSGGLLIDEMQVNSQTPSYQVDLDIDRDNNIILSWYHDINPSDIIIKKLNSEGSTVFDEVNASSYYDDGYRNRNPEIETDSSNNVLLTFYRYADMNYEIVLQKFNDQGQLTATDRQVDDKLHGEIANWNEIAVNNSNTSFIYWVKEDSNADPNNYNATVKSYDGDSQASTQQSIAFAENRIYSGKIAVSPSGDFLVTYYKQNEDKSYAVKLNGDFKNAGSVKKLTADAGSGNKYRWDKLSWEAEEPDDSVIKARVRTADSENALAHADWSPYYEVSGIDISNITVPSRYLEIEVMLDANSEGDSPVVDNVTVDYNSVSSKTDNWTSKSDFDAGTKNRLDTSSEPGKVKIASGLIPKLDFSSIGDDQVWSEFGTSVASAGDVNNDGYDDVIAGARYYSATSEYAGKAYLHLGSSSGFTSAPAWTSSGDDVFYALFGSAVSSAGDVNNDGYDDILVGAYYQGKSFMFLGGLAGPSTTADWTYSGGGYLGFSVASAGDVNNDNYDDVIVGTYNDNTVYLFYGGASGLSAAPDWTETGINQFGSSVSGAGDVNNDGYDDVIIGGYETDEAYLYLGSASGLSSEADWTHGGFSFDNNGYFGKSVSSAGDVNNDGYDDVLIGEYNYEPSENLQTGAAFIFNGTSSGLSSNSYWSSTGESENNADFGYSVAGAGDVNNDGYDDVLIGTNSKSEVFLYYGNQNEMDDSFVWKGIGESILYGTALDSAGDVNNDGYDDFIVGDYYYNGTGKIYGYLSSNQSGYYSTGTLSQIIDAGAYKNANWLGVSWDAEVPAGASVKFKARGASTQARLDSADWSKFIDANTDEWRDNIYNVVKSSRWLELKAFLFLSSTNETPELESYTLNYTVYGAKGACYSCHSSQLPSDEFNRYFETKTVSLDKCVICHGWDRMGYTDDFYEEYYGEWVKAQSVQLSNSKTVRAIHEWHEVTADEVGGGGSCVNCHYAAACTKCHEVPVTHSTHAGGSYPGVTETYSKGYEQGSEELALTCTNQNCHGSLNEGNFTYRPSCANCHYRDKANRKDLYIEQPGHGDIDTKHTSSRSDCTSCHGGSNISDYHDEKGLNCETCHESPSSQIIFSIRQNENNCTSYCHQNYHDGIEEKHTYDGLTAKCSKCHSNILTQEHEARGKNCTTCHDDSINSSTSCTACHRSFSSHSSSNCSSCHSASYDTCTSCHVDKQNHKSVVECSSCHTNGFDVHHYSSAYSYKSCLTCHYDVDHSLDSLSSTCQLCHPNVQHDDSFSFEALMASRGSNGKMDHDFSISRYGPLPLTKATKSKNKQNDENKILKILMFAGGIILAFGIIVFVIDFVQRIFKKGTR